MNIHTFEAAMLTKNDDLDKYKHFGYVIGFDARKSFLLSDSSGFGKNIIKFSDEMSCSVHVDNRKNRF